MEGDVDGSIMQTTVRFLTFTLTLLPSFSTWKRLAGINKLRLRDSRGQGGKLKGGRKGKNDGKRQQPLLDLRLRHRDWPIRSP